jgi:predicted DNA-binding protein (UPF0251 family)
MAPSKRQRAQSKPQTDADRPAGPTWHRTTVYLATDEYEALRLRAFRDRCTMAELVRQAVRTQLGMSHRRGGG